MIIATMRASSKMKNFKFRELKKSSKVLIVSRELPCRLSKLLLMNGLETFMDALHQSKYLFLTPTVDVPLRLPRLQSLLTWSKRN